MLTALIPCPRCGHELPADSTRAGGASCYHCETLVEATLFAAAFREHITPEDTAAESGEAGCFFHQTRAAVTPCSHCGRFLCNLCRIDWSGTPLCMVCIEAFQKAPQSSFLAASRTHFDSIALTLATVPSLLVFPSFLTAPLSLGMSIFTLRKPASITPRSKWRYYLAGFLALAQIILWIWFIVYSILQAAGRPPK